MLGLPEPQPQGGTTLGASILKNRDENDIIQKNRDENDIIQEFDTIIFDQV